MNLGVKAAPKAEMAYKNQVYVHPSDHATLTSFAPLSKAKDKVDVEVLGKVWACAPSDDVAQGTIALSMLQRSFAGAALDVVIPVRPFTPPKDKPFALAEVKIRVAPFSKPKAGSTSQIIVEAEKLQAEFRAAFKDQVLSPGLKMAHIYQGTTALSLEVAGLRLASTLQTGESTGEQKKSQFGMEPELGLFADKLTELNFLKTEGIQIKGQVTERSVNKMLEVNFEALGIGGLDKEFTQIFRRAFASRVYPPEMVANMGINHVRGLILFGPPGCGKTLIARQISKALVQSTGNSEEKRREPKVVNGPEILSKFVGEAEKNIRELFADAEAEQNEFGNESELHVIIFDEFDAIAKKRGSSRDGTGVHDSIVNQLLSKIDGVNALNNVLLIAMTNRLDMLDPALLRPGRFEVQVEISLPDQHGRVQILNIHTVKMRKAGYLASDVDIDVIAEKTKNFTGAEIEGLVKDAGGFAFQRQVDTKNFKVVNPKELSVTMSDFEEALKECKPQFGTLEVEEEMKRNLGLLVPFSSEFENVRRMLSDLTKRAASDAGSNMSLVSVLLCGDPGSGKTALATKIASESGFPLVRIVSPDKLIGMSEQSKSAAIADIFDEAYKSEKSLILLEDIERIIDFTRSGPRFSNQVLQTLLILVRKPPPKKGKRVFILGTTSIPELMEPLDVLSVFNMALHVPQVKTTEEVYRVVKQVLHEKGSEDEIVAISRMCPLPISVKKLMLALEMAQRDGALSPQSFGEFLAVT